MKRTVKDLMRQKDITRIPSVDQTATIEDGLLTLEELHCSALIVLEDGQPAGVFSERDFARAALNSNGFVALNHPIAALMSRKVVYVTPEYRLEECMAIMSKFKFRHLLVLDHGAAVAFLSMRHIMEALIEDKSFMIDELTTYITGPVRFEAAEIRDPLVRELQVTADTWR